MTLRPGVGRIIQLQKRIKDLKKALEPFAKCLDPDSESCGECDGCKAKKELEK